jgi:hypothetical protein
MIFACLVIFGLPTHAEEQGTNEVLTAVSSTTLNGYVDTSVIWDFPPGESQKPCKEPILFSGAEMRAMDEVARRGGINYPEVPLLPEASASVVVIPEPATWTLAAVGATFIIAIGRCSGRGRK